MKTSIYQVRGCSGNLYYREIDTVMYTKDAQKQATKLNKSNADRLGISYRQYIRRSYMKEGWYVSGKSGYDNWELL